MIDRTADVIVVGAGIVGLASAWQIAQRFPDLKIRILEKEGAPAHHQTGHNSGVLHSGIYYRPGSLKARNCRRGLDLMRKFCDRENLPYEICGKVIVALDEEEETRLGALRERGLANGVDCDWLSPEELREREPHCQARRALLVRDAGIIDYAQVARRLAERLQGLGHDWLPNQRVIGFHEERSSVRVWTPDRDFLATRLVVCGGLQADRLARSAGLDSDTVVVPFRGEFFELTPEAEPLCRHLIYPVPDPRFPFLGVHLTRTIHGGRHVGPNASPSFSREGYGRGSINPGDLSDMLLFGGFWRLGRRHWRMGLAELRRTFSRAAFLAALRRLVPELEDRHLVSAPAGIRAQAVRMDGVLVDDFVIRTSPRMVHVINAPSPAATASLAIGEQVAARLPRS